MENESFVIYHADELKDTITITRMRIQLENIPGVRLESLKAWYQRVYAPEFGPSAFENFRGFMCKTAALLAAPFNEVLLMDLDVIMMENPFVLLSTPEYARQGAYLFADRRNKESSKMTKAYANHLRQLWRRVNPDTYQTNVPFLNKLPPMTGLTSHYGESAVVLFNKGLNSNALSILEKLLSPDIFEDTTKYIYGDKELYWRVLVFAGVNVSMNPFLVSEVGTPTKTDEGFVTCSHKYVFAQWIWRSYSTPRVLYINGDGVEDMLMSQDHVLPTCTISDPMEYHSTFVEHKLYCGKGANPLPTTVINTFWAYKIMYSKSFIQLPR